MRSHGVPHFPDPSGSGIHIGPGSGIDPSSPAFKAARSVCVKLLPGGGPGNQRPSAQQIEMTLQISECMRQHGVTGFPDPSFNTPSDRADYSIVMDLSGVILAVPNTIDPSSPVFVQAAKTCGFSGPGAWGQPKRVPPLDDRGADARRPIVRQLLGIETRAISAATEELPRFST